MSAEYLQHGDDGAQGLDELAPGRRRHPQSALQQVQQDGLGRGAHLPTTRIAVQGGGRHVISRTCDTPREVWEAATVSTSSFRGPISTASSYILFSTSLSPFNGFPFLFIFKVHFSIE